MRELRDYQIEAISKLKTGSILCGGVGSGKSFTSLAYYFQKQGGSLNPFKKATNPKDLYIITTARKRDTKEWESELTVFLMSTDNELNNYNNKIIVDSWNNIGKYVDAKDAFFIFDEQRVIGNGTWTKFFLKICKVNDWILLSATPGDTWMDYIPVFVANGFYRNRSDFINQHVIYSRYSKFPKVDKYLNTGKLLKYRNSILVDMKFERQTVSHHEDVWCNYDVTEYKWLLKNRFDKETEVPIKNMSELCYKLRKIVNSDESRAYEILRLVYEKKRCIVFYNFDYELDILKNIDYGEDYTIAEWNGHKHESIPDSEKWVYLVQYTAGAEGWNCTLTDTIIFYSQNYSYKIVIQSAGRIDRLNTPYTDLYYYHLKSRAGIDLEINKALQRKRKFNESNFTCT